MKEGNKQKTNKIQNTNIPSLLRHCFAPTTLSVYLVSGELARIRGEMFIRELLVLYNFRISDGSDSVALLKHSEGRIGIRIVELCRTSETL